MEPSKKGTLKMVPSKINQSILKLCCCVTFTVIFFQKNDKKNLAGKIYQAKEGIFENDSFKQ